MSTPQEPFATPLTWAATQPLAKTLAAALTNHGYVVVESASVHPRGLVAVGAIRQPVAAPVADAVTTMQLLNNALGRLDHPASETSGDPTWARVIDLRTLAPTGVELWVSSDDDASRQLDLLAKVAFPEIGPRELITIHPPPGWNGYGDPRLVARYRQR
jgi:hypothetical protein